MATATFSAVLTRSDLSALYHTYIASINAGSIATDIPHYCHDEVIYNDKHLTRAAYQARIDSAFEHMLDAHFAAELMSVDAEQQLIAARLVITGTLVKPFEALDLEPGPGKAMIYEHVFYDFTEGKISRVWTLLQAGDIMVEP